MCVSTTELMYTYGAANVLYLAASGVGVLDVGLD